MHHRFRLHSARVAFEPRRAAALSALVLLLLAPGVVYGWGAAGHQAVGEIAWHYLTPEAQEALRKLMRSASYDELSEVGYWADAHARGYNRYWEYGRRHYVNVDPDADVVVMDRDCPEDCILTALETLTAALAERGARRGSEDDLRFLVHFIQDLHQPLHVSHPDNRGGNLTQVTLFGEEMNIHWAWDGGLIQRRLAHYGERPDAERFRRGWRADERWRQWAYDLRLTIGPDELRSWSADLDPIVWAEESLVLSREHTFEVEDGAELGEVYYQATIPVVEERIKQAGVRLAAVLNQLFSEQRMLSN